MSGKETETYSKSSIEDPNFSSAIHTGLALIDERYKLHRHLNKVVSTANSSPDGTRSSSLGSEDLSEWHPSNLAHSEEEHTEISVESLPGWLYVAMDSVEMRS